MKQKAKIVVVDDQSAIRDLLDDFLTSQGYDVHCYSSARAALKSLEIGPQVQAVLSDVRMKPMTGLELLENIRKRNLNVPVLLFTSAGSWEERRQAIDAGAFDYLTQPFTLTELKGKLEAALIAWSPKPGP